MQSRRAAFPSARAVTAIIVDARRSSAPTALGRKPQARTGGGLPGGGDRGDSGPPSDPKRPPAGVAPLQHDPHQHRARARSRSGAAGRSSMSRSIDGIRYPDPVPRRHPGDPRRRPATWSLTHEAGLAFFHPEHNQWPSRGWRAFEIRRGRSTGPAITSGHQDHVSSSTSGRSATTAKRRSSLPRACFECTGDFQGFAAHWADEYHQSDAAQGAGGGGLADGDLLPPPPRPTRSTTGSRGRMGRGKQLALGEVPPRRARGRGPR